MGIESAPNEVPALASAGDFFPLLDPMECFAKRYAERIRTYREVLQPAN
jgi:hypothetical protein